MPVLDKAARCYGLLDAAPGPRTEGPTAASRFSYVKVWPGPSALGPRSACRGLPAHWCQRRGVPKTAQPAVFWGSSPFEGLSESLLGRHSKQLVVLWSHFGRGAAEAGTASTRPQASRDLLRASKPQMARRSSGCDRMISDSPAKLSPGLSRQLLSGCLSVTYGPPGNRQPARRQPFPSVKGNRIREMCRWHRGEVIFFLFFLFFLFFFFVVAAMQLLVVLRGALEQGCCLQSFRLSAGGVSGTLSQGGVGRACPVQQKVGHNGKLQGRARPITPQR